MPLDELPIEVSMTDCRHCRISIPKKASVCPHCNKSQVWWQSWLESIAGLARVVSIVVSIVLVALSWRQLELARAQLDQATSQRMSADLAARVAQDASTKADDASTEANVAKGEAVQARDEARNVLALLRSMVKLMLEREAALDRLLMESSDTVKAARLTQELKEFAVPDSKERQKWEESLKTKTK